MKIADLTPFFHEKSGGIKRYLLEKINFLENTPEASHFLIIPGKREKITQIGKSKIYEISSFPIPRSGGYRFFLSLRRIREILEEEKPDILELGGWYQFTEKFKNKKYFLSLFYHSDITLYMGLIPFISKFKDYVVQHFLKKNFLQLIWLFLLPRGCSIFLDLLVLKR